MDEVGETDLFVCLSAENIRHQIGVRRHEKGFEFRLRAPHGGGSVVFTKQDILRLLEVFYQEGFHSPFQEWGQNYPAYWIDPGVPCSVPPVSHTPGAVEQPPLRAWNDVITYPPQAALNPGRNPDWDLREQIEVLRSMVDHLSSNVAGHNANIHDMEKRLDQVSKTRDATYSRVAGLENKVIDTENRRTQLGAELYDLRSRVDNLEAKPAPVGIDLPNVERRVTCLEGRITPIGSNLIDVERRVMELEKRHIEEHAFAGGLSERLDSVETRISHQEKRTDAREKRTCDLEHKAREAQTRMDDQSEALGSHLSSIQKLAERLDGQEREQKYLRSRISAAADDVAQCWKKVLER